MYIGVLLFMTLLENKYCPNIRYGAQAILRRYQGNTDKSHKCTLAYYSFWYNWKSFTPVFVMIWRQHCEYIEAIMNTVWIAYNNWISVLSL